MSNCLLRRIRNYKKKHKRLQNVDNRELFQIELVSHEGRNFEAVEDCKTDYIEDVYRLPIINVLVHTLHQLLQ